MRNRLPSGHGWAYLGVALGLTASIVGNVANTVLTVSGVPLELRVPFAVIWPVFLGIGIEVLTRIDWKAGWKHWAARAILVGPMSLVSGFMSYLHLHHLMILSGEPGLAQAVGPLAVDGTLFGCTVALLVTRSKARDTDAAPRMTLAQRVAAARQTALDVKAAAAGQEDPAQVVEGPRSAITQDPTVPVLEIAQDPESDSFPQDLPEDPAPVSPAPVRTQRGTVDYARVLRAVLDNAKDQAVVDLVGGSTKTSQRVRRAVRLMDTTQDLAAIASTVKLPLAAVTTIQKELKG